MAWMRMRRFMDRCRGSLGQLVALRGADLNGDEWDENFAKQTLMTRYHDGNAAFCYHQEFCEVPGTKLIMSSFACDDREESSCITG